MHTYIVKQNNNKKSNEYKITYKNRCTGYQCHLTTIKNSFQTQYLNDGKIISIITVNLSNNTHTHTHTKTIENNVNTKQGHNTPFPYNKRS